ncbi:hypothetical protein DVH05_009959 [Phytophthora capsici]|nr:hypothetical protein DVH05_009959 [Phytophthora capsici]
MAKVHTSFLVVVLLATSVNAAYVRRLTNEESDQKSIHIKIKVHSDERLSTDDTMIPEWGQCGGKNFDKPGSSCENGYRCVVINELFHQCQPNHEQDRFTHVERWKQCGGENYYGPSECVEGSVCKFYSKLFSQCVPEG